MKIRLDDETFERDLRMLSPKTPWQETGSLLASDMSDKLDAVIKTALDKHLVVWSIDDLKRRCTLTSRPGSEIQTLCVDGRPILEIHPIQFETVRTDTGWTLRATQNYRSI